MKQTTRYTYYSQQRLLTFVFYSLTIKTTLTIGSVDQKHLEQLEASLVSSSILKLLRLHPSKMSNSEGTEGLEQVRVSLLGRRQGTRRRRLCFSQA